MNPASNIVILTGTGRSGTTFMTQILREVYGIGMSAEPKDVLDICRYAAKMNINDQEDLDKVVKRALASKTFGHLLQKGIATELDAGRMKAHISHNTVEGVMLGMFGYMAELRGADFPGFKDPLILQQVDALNEFLPKSCFINMIRRGENVASSTLKFNWGATNTVAGIVDWRKTLNMGMDSFDKLGKGRVLNLKLEALEEDFDNFCEQLDSFVNNNIGRSNLEYLKTKLSSYKKPLKNYEIPGFKSKIVSKLAYKTNKRLGYTSRVSSSNIWWYELLAIPFLVVDFGIRAFRRVMRK